MTRKEKTVTAGTVVAFAASSIFHAVYALSVINSLFWGGVFALLVMGVYLTNNLKH